MELEFSDIFAESFGIVFLASALVFCIRLVRNSFLKARFVTTVGIVAIGKLILRNPLNGFQTIIRRAEERFGDWKRNMSTARHIPAAELGFTNREFHEYGATDYRTINRMLNALDIDPSEHVFIDFGSGMGRVVVVAAERPFKRVIGIDVSEDLNRIAQENITRAKPRGCPNVEIVTADASRYAFPEDVTIVFIAFSFVGQTLRQTLANLKRSIDEHPRRVLIAYSCPEPDTDLEEALDECEWLNRREMLRLARGRYRAIYESRQPVASPTTELSFK